MQDALLPFPPNYLIPRSSSIYGAVAQGLLNLETIFLKIGLPNKVIAL